MLTLVLAGAALPQVAVTVTTEELGAVTPRAVMRSGAFSELRAGSKTTVAFAPVNVATQAPEATELLAPAEGARQSTWLADRMQVARPPLSNSVGHACLPLESMPNIGEKPGVPVAADGSAQKPPAIGAQLTPAGYEKEIPPGTIVEAFTALTKITGTDADVEFAPPAVVFAYFAKASAVACAVHTTVVGEAEVIGVHSSSATSTRRPLVLQTPVLRGAEHMLEPYTVIGAPTVALFPSPEPAALVADDMKTPVRRPENVLGTPPATSLTARSTELDVDALNNLEAATASQPKHTTVVLLTELTLRGVYAPCERQRTPPMLSITS